MDRELDAIARDATPWLGRDPRGDAPFSANQVIANRFLCGVLWIGCISAAGSLLVYWSLASQETAAAVEQERVIRDQRYLQGLTAATASGREMEFMCAAVPVLGAQDAKPGGAYWAVRQRCEGFK
jgi:hypothetical protein